MVKLVTTHCPKWGSLELRGQLLETRRCAVRSALLRVQHAQQLSDCIAQMSVAHKSGMGGLRSPVLHALRDDMRNLTLFWKARQRRRDMVDLHKVDRKLLQNVFRHLPRETHPSFRFLLQGARLIVCTVLPGVGPTRAVRIASPLLKMKSTAFGFVPRGMILFTSRC